MKAVLVLRDGTYFTGESFGAGGEAYGEIVFNTSMTGYQEITTDPSYNGQIVCMTYPLIGNYGMNNEDTESYKPHVEGFIVKELCENHSNFRALTDPYSYFKDHGIIGIKGIDTRALTR
ncbi:MAG TPA: carbamoyl-phosphate synthase domain-containing protein, partial [Clostridia bacterium]|nr:carbamoyl-phosphate synthase domain-containing protein [Clostridia bacterium]